MKWDERLNKAINYIEANLRGEIDMDKVANIMCQSKDSFQRTFSLIMNISINEYIRKRRMTLAATLLRRGNVKIIDLALQFGYESPESFTRAFKEVFGMPPSAARDKNVRLTLFPRVTCLLTIKGDIQMESRHEVESNCELEDRLEKERGCTTENKFEADIRPDNMNGQAINWKGFDWASWPSPENQMRVYDNCKSTAKKWKDAGHKNILDLGAGMGKNSIYFAKLGFEVSAIEISDYAVEYMQSWAKKEGLSINAAIGDMHMLPYKDSSFDCLFEYHTIRHTDSAGMRKIIAEIERVVRPGGEVYLTFISKASNEFEEKWWPLMDASTMISQNPAEKGIPHFYADLSDLNELLANFDIESIEHLGYFADGDAVRQKHYYVSAKKRPAAVFENKKRAG